MASGTGTDAKLAAELDGLRRRILDGDNAACFIERQRTLLAVEPEAAHVPPGRRYAFVLDRMLAEVSTPIEPEDVILGRMVEGRWPDGGPDLRVTHPLIRSRAHLTLDWHTLLSRGLGGIERDARDTARRLATDDARQFADNAGICVRAVAVYARRYADHARALAPSADPTRRADLIRAADALDRVPGEPARNFFDAIQSIWLVHMVTSCYIGSRDFALGRMDQYLWPFYQQGLADGSLDPPGAVALLAHFLMKTNEITGTGAYNYRQKPIPCQSSKQYLVLGGRASDGTEQANELSGTILDAAGLVRMPQPVLTVRMDAHTSPGFKRAVARAVTVLGSQVNVFNDAIVVPAITRAGLGDAEAHDYAMVGCCRLDMPGRTVWNGDQFLDATHWLLAAMNGGRHPVDGRVWVAGLREPDQLHTLDDVFDQFRTVATHQVQHTVDQVADWYRRTAAGETDEPRFHFESLLLGDCVARGKDCFHGGARNRMVALLLGGIATVANSLMTIKRLVFDEHRLGLRELLAMCRSNFAGHEHLRQEIVHQLPKFGNDDDEVDTLACRAGNIMLDAVACARVPDGLFLPGAGFYSLESHHRWGRELPATPDGRRRGEPVSENQSPVYGTDVKGVTAVLRSVAKLPLERTVQGGLNVKFAASPAPDKLAGLVDSYFRMGGLHVGFTFASRDTLIDARAHPDRYRTLCVRLYGFSEYFVALSPEEQQELIDRTEHAR